MSLKITNIGYKDEYIQVDVTDMEYSGGTIVITAPDHGFFTNDTARFERSIDTSLLQEDVIVTVLDKDRISIPVFEDLLIMQSGSHILTIERCNGYENGEPIIENVEVLMLTFDIPHNFVRPYDYSIYYQIQDIHEFYDEGPTEAFCTGLPVMYGQYVYLPTELNEDGRFILKKDEILNEKYVEIYYADDDGNRTYLKHGFTQLDYDLFLDRHSVFFEITEENREICEYINANFEYLELFSKDERFITTDEIGKPVFVNLPGEAKQYLYKYTGGFKIDFPLFEDISDNLSEDDIAVNIFAQNVANGEIDTPIDYERVVFSPVTHISGDIYDTNDTLFGDVSEIEFNLHFKDRHDVTNHDDSDWVSDDTKMWNNYEIVIDSGETAGHYKIVPTKKGLTPDDADLLADLNFVDDDVFFQVNALYQSFIRLSFYDSPDRNTQTLLFYSTIFYDTGKAYNKLIQAMLNNGAISTFFNEGSIEYVSNEHLTDGHKDLRLSAKFNVFDKYELNSSSEGFYLYLFPSLLTGSDVTEIYMKVEFNHARYGRTIPFVMPNKVNEDGTVRVLNPEDAGFPLNYMKKNDSGKYVGVDYKKLMSDMYIKILIKKDFKNNRYVWYLPNNDNTGKLVFNLYEPRINASDDESYLIGYEEEDYGYEQKINAYFEFVNATRGDMTFTVAVNNGMAGPVVLSSRTNVSGNMSGSKNSNDEMSVIIKLTSNDPQKRPCRAIIRLYNTILYRTFNTDTTLEFSGQQAEKLFMREFNNYNGRFIIDIINV